MLLNIKETSIRCNGEIEIVDMRWCRVMSVFSKTLARLENCARVVNVSEAGPMSLLLGKKRMSRFSSDSSIFRGKNTKEPICWYRIHTCPTILDPRPQRKTRPIHTIHLVDQNLSSRGKSDYANNHIYHKTTVSNWPLLPLLH